MAKAEWGRKRTCPSCGVQYYDLRRKKIICPKCGAPYEAAPAAKAKRPPAPFPAPASKPETTGGDAIEPPPEDAEPATAGSGDKGTDEAAEVKGNPVDAGQDDAEPENSETKSADDELIEDTSDLSEDEDDISEVKEHIDDGISDKS